MGSRAGLKAGIMALALLAASGAILAGGLPAQAQGYSDMSCRELWYARNQIFAEKGYCFETRRARRAFGPGCFPPYGRLSPDEQDEVDRIKRWERRNGCD